MSERKYINGWHFAGKTLRDGRPLPHKGETLLHDGAVKPCQSGFHASERAIDALEYAPGTMVARVRLSGDLNAHGKPTDKWVGRKRKMLTDYVDCRDVLVEWARRCALRAARVRAAQACREAGMHSQADALAALPDNATCQQIEAAAWDARDAAGDAWAAAWDAAGDAWDAECNGQNAELEAMLTALLED